MPERITFQSREAANAFRDEYPDAVTGQLDRRFATVELRDDASEDAQREAAIQQAVDDSLTPANLTDGEKRRLDFSKAGVNVPKLRWVKGIANAEGVDDWTAYFDPTLTVDEHREVMARAARDETGGGDADEPDAAKRSRDAALTAEGEECDHAAGHCQYGNPDACEFLAETCGYSEEEVAGLMGTADASPGDSDEPPASAQVTWEDLDGVKKGALARSWNGYKAAVAELDRHLSEVAAAFANAEQAAAAIDGIEDGLKDQDTGEFRRLAEHHRTLRDLFDRHEGEYHGQPDVTGPPDEWLAAREPLRTEESDAPMPPLSRVPSYGRPDDLGGRAYAVDLAAETPAPSEEWGQLAADRGPPQQRLASGVDPKRERSRERRYEAERSTGGLMADTRESARFGAARDVDTGEQESLTDGPTDAGQAQIDD